MAIDWNLFKFSKGTPKAVEKDVRDRERDALDEKESAKVKTRSRGQCEIKSPERCTRRASQVHHMIGGWGKRARGESVLATKKQHACTECHDLITSKRLVRVGGDEPKHTDKYRRIRSKKAVA